MRRLLGLIALIIFSSCLHAEEKMKVFDMRGSIFMHVWHLIVEEAGIAPDYVDLTQAEARNMFAQGQIMLTCCTIPEWRARPDEMKVQVFTKPFFYIVNHIVFKNDRILPLPDPNDLTAYKAVTVKGYTFESAVKFGDLVYVDTLEDALKMVAEEKADLTIANNQEF